MCPTSIIERIHSRTRIIAHTMSDNQSGRNYPYMENVIVDLENHLKVLDKCKQVLYHHLDLGKKPEAKGL